MPEAARATLTIDLDALAQNYATLKEAATGAEVAPVVKSDAYGLGAGPVGRRLWAEGARSFFVARLDEGERLRVALGGDRPAEIYVLDGFAAAARARYEASALTPALASAAQVRAVREWSAAPRMALHVDTGMNRQGLTVAEAIEVAQSGDGPQISLVMSHLGAAATPTDPNNARQLARFRAIRAAFPTARASLAASAGAFLGEDYRFDLVRPGVSLYGGGPLERPHPRLKAVATLRAPVVDIRSLGAGDRLGYGDYTVDRPLRCAIVAAGYSDGMIRDARRGAYAWLAGAARPILIINMDILAIEIGAADVAIGDSVELLGEHALLDDFATAARTVAHEVLTRISSRAERRYAGETA
ncbi:alanine racemase [Phenylobacterium immobile]|uniref:alanine racemase n=1 Tax=Phenylobacterium immobile TaxID=21 RepID=UPI000A4CDD88|nr:alanine racemase [Phenylobacterium immobile]